MTKVTIIDLDAMLAPLPGEPTTGIDPREDFTAQSLYYKLRDARAEARAAERESDGSGITDAAPPLQWRTVRDLSARILTERAKDLEAASWLTEALVRDAGLDGLTAGAALIDGLVTQFWDAGLFPTPDEDGLETLLAPISGLSGTDADGTLAQTLRKVALFARPDGTEVALWEYLQSQDVEQIGDAARKKQRLASGTIPFGDLDRDAKIAGGAHFNRLRGQADTALAAIDQLGAGLDTKAGGDSPSLRRLRELVATIGELAHRYAPPRAAAETPQEDVADAPGADQPADGPAAARATVARPVTREDMLADLARIADFFRKAEPQSPLALTLDEAIRRARLTWPELLLEVAPSEDIRKSMMTMLGIRPPEPPPS